MDKDIGRIYKHSQSPLSALLFKAPVCSYLASQKASFIELTTTSVPSVREKNQNNYVLCSKNSIHNDISIINNNDIKSCETARNINIAFQPLQILIKMHRVLLTRP